MEAVQGGGQTAHPDSMGEAAPDDADERWLADYKAEQEERRERRNREVAFLDALCKSTSRPTFLSKALLGLDAQGLAHVVFHYLLGCRADRITFSKAWVEELEQFLD
ncbi:MAG: hypothetical protein JOY71_23170 [Acetobacteraceae bacterium]|nr:hypothetical protein [Acetobacteraceae bacterium]